MKPKITLPGVSAVIAFTIVAADQALQYYEITSQGYRYIYPGMAFYMLNFFMTLAVIYPIGWVIRWAWRRRKR